MEPDPLPFVFLQPPQPCPPRSDPSPRLWRPDPAPTSPDLPTDGSLGGGLPGTDEIDLATLELELELGRRGQGSHAGVTCPGRCHGSPLNSPEHLDGDSERVGVAGGNKRRVLDFVPGGRPLNAADAPDGLPLPDNDDLLREILLRLPPLPSSFPRASLVSKRWRGILSDPHFIRRFRAFHHRRAPLLGLFILKFKYGNAYFTPTLDPPNRIPYPRLAPPLYIWEGWRFLDCRHGLVLFVNRKRMEITVWDSVTEDQRCVALPPGFNSRDPECGALLCDDHAGRVPLESFKVALLLTDRVRRDDVHPHTALGFLYESKADMWCNIISTSITADIFDLQPSVLVGNSLYWFLDNFIHGYIGILKLDLDRKNLTVIDTPRSTLIGKYWKYQILRLEDSRLGFADVIGFNIQVWEKKPNSEGGSKWMLHKTINVGKLLSLVPAGPSSRISIHGYDEDGDAVFLSSSDDPQVFMVQLKSLHFKSLFKQSSNTDGTYYPFTSFFTTGKGIGSGDIGAEILNNT